MITDIAGAVFGLWPDGFPKYFRPKALDCIDDSAQGEAYKPFRRNNAA